VIATFRARTPTLGPVSFPDLQDYRASTHYVFEDIAGYSVGFLGLANEEAQPERILVDWVTGNYFPLLGIQPALGRSCRKRTARLATAPRWPLSATRRGYVDSEETRPS